MSNSELLFSRIRRALKRMVRGEHGEVASWLVLGAGLAGAALLASATMSTTIDGLAGDVAVQANAESSVGPGGNPGPGTDPGTGTDVNPDPTNNLGNGGGDGNHGDGRDGRPTGEPRDGYTEIGSEDTVPSVTGPPILGEPLPDLDNTDNWFVAGDHVYSHLSDATSADYDTLMNAVNADGVHPWQSEPFVPGEPYEGDVRIFVVSNDPIRSTALYDANGNQVGVRNETAPGHALHPGWVERSIVQQPNGDYRIQTIGGGTGTMGGPNVWFDPIVWGRVDNNALRGLPGASE